MFSLPRATVSRVSCGSLLKWGGLAANGCGTVTGVLMGRTRLGACQCCSSSALRMVGKIRSTNARCQITGNSFSGRISSAITSKRLGSLVQLRSPTCPLPQCPTTRTRWTSMALRRPPISHFRLRRPRASGVLPIYQLKPRTAYHGAYGVSFERYWPELPLMTYFAGLKSTDQ